jgi:uncharacterized protein YbaR (Trm112 family)
MSSLDPFLLEVIACPLCRRSLEVGDDRLTCGTCRRWFPVIEGIPVLLVSEARLIEGDAAEGPA